MRTLLALATISVAGLLAGCGHLGALRETAAEDFHCPEHQIEIFGHGRERTAEGCGQSGGYRWTGRSWVRDGAGTRPGSANGPPPVNPAQPAPKGPQPVKVQPAQPSGPNAPLPPSQPPPGQSL